MDFLVVPPCPLPSSGHLFEVSYSGNTMVQKQDHVALHRSARVEWSPRKCQISLIFSDLFTDFTRSWHEWEEWSGRRMEPHIFTLHREQEWKTQCRMAHGLFWHPEQWLSQGPLAGSAMCDTTQHCFPGLQLHHGLCFTLLLPKEFGRENREHHLEGSPSARADPAYSLLPNLSLLLMCVILSCVDLPVCTASTPGHL